MISRSSSFLAVLLLLFIFPRLTVAQAYENQLKTMAVDLVVKLEAAGQRSGTVLDFTDLQGAPTELGRFLAQELSDQLVSVGGKISFVDRANLQHLLREQKLSVEGLVNPQSSKRLGNLIGIDTIIFGNTTPMGNKIRLSVRAVAVETGKIIGTQSTTLDAIAGLGEMQHRGVATTSSPSTVSASRSSDPRTRLRGDTIKMTVKNVSDAPSVSGIVTFEIENLSGLGFDAGIEMGSTSIGPCMDPHSRLSTGLMIVESRDPGAGLRFFPPGSKIIVSIRLGCFNLPRSGPVDVSTALVIRYSDALFTVPLSGAWNERIW